MPILPWGGSFLLIQAWAHSRPFLSTHIGSTPGDGPSGKQVQPLVPGRITAIVAMSIMVAFWAMAAGAADIALLILAGLVVGGATGPTWGFMSILVGAGGDAWDARATAETTPPITTASNKAETRSFIRTSCPLLRHFIPNGYKGAEQPLVHLSNRDFLIDDIAHVAGSRAAVRDAHKALIGRYGQNAG